MTPVVAFVVAVTLVCATLITCTWIVAERWYAHRDRAYQRLVTSAEVTATLAIEDVRKAARIAGELIEERATASLAHVGELDREVKRLLEAEQERARIAAYGGGRGRG